MVTAESFETFPTPITIGVVADTHLRSSRVALPRALVDGLAGVDLILHAGDIVTEDALGLFEQLAPVRAVAGNNDEPSLKAGLPLRRFLRLGPFRLGMLHGHGAGRLTARQAAEQTMAPLVDIVVFGHSHRAVRERLGDVLLFNPGSPTDPRWEPRASFGLLHVGDGVDAEIRYIARRS